MHLYFPARVRKWRRLILTETRISILLEINFAGIIGIECAKDMCAEGFRLSVGKELPVDLNKFLLC